jgi:cardiolipin synthase C
MAFPPWRVPLSRRSRHLLLTLGALLAAGSPCWATSSEPKTDPEAVARRALLLAESRPGETGVYILEDGREALLARAWMVNNVARTLDVQTFIWEMDGVGTLATEALLRAAERGARVRVLVDAITRDVPRDLLLALARHPNMEIRIYNPPGSGKLGWLDLLLELFFDFRAFNQRMHNKKFMVDGIAAITGGRNVADEYFDYSQKYNFRDRDVLLLGAVVEDMEQSFDAYWTSSLTKSVEELWERRNRRLSLSDAEAIWRELRQKATDPEIVPREVQGALEDQPGRFRALLDRLVWTDVRFVADRPKKNIEEPGLGGGGRTAAAVVGTLEAAKERIVIETPYLVLTDDDLRISEELFRGVEVWISTNSLASTDNVPTFSGYRKQRDRLLELGVELREFQPHPALQREEMTTLELGARKPPILVLHAKTVVVDSSLLFIGTFNLDPRSANLNTEEGVVIRNRELAETVEAQIRRHMQPENSWNPRLHETDREASRWRRFRAWVYGLFPLSPLL